ncbi:MAG: DegT/DnrJ/EryC1/StrS family aminotransferase [Candidatus Nitrosocaldaceae archaeon]
MQISNILQFVPYWDDEERRAVNEVLMSNYLNEHKRVREFEERFAEFVGAKYCVACTSGTMALWLALETVKLMHKIDNINIPTLHGIFAYNAATLAGLNIDIIDVDDIYSATKNPKLPIHINGRYKEYEDTRNIYVEDCCQAINYHTKYMLSCYSFASTKHLTTFGQGGAVCCDKKDEYEILIKLKDHGRADRAYLKPVSDDFGEFGINLKMTEVQAAFGLIQLKKLPNRLKRLEYMYRLYKDLLDKSILMLDDIPMWYVDIYLPTRKVRDYIHEELKKYEISTRIYNKPLHKQSIIKKSYSCPMGEWYAEHGLFLPSTTNLTDEEIHYICKSINIIIKS